MRQHLELSQVESDEVHSVLIAISKRLKSPATLGGLLKQWDQLIAEVERGYRFTVYDYTNDLSVRDDLEHLISGVSPDLRQRLTAGPKPLDERFELATEDAPRFLQPRPHKWWRRVPRKPIVRFLLSVSD